MKKGLLLAFGVGLAISAMILILKKREQLEDTYYLEEIK